MAENNPNGSLKVLIVNCVNVPNPERFGTVDPYVNLMYQGIKKRTQYKKSELNPSWNEVRINSSSFLLFLYNIYNYLVFFLTKNKETRIRFKRIASYFSRFHRRSNKRLQKRWK